MLLSLLEDRIKSPDNFFPENSFIAHCGVLRILLSIQLSFVDAVTVALLTNAQKNNLTCSLFFAVGILLHAKV